MPNLVKNFQSMKGEIIAQNDDTVTLRKLVTTNGSPDAKDLHGEFFKTTTYFGDDVITQKFALYDHLLNPLLNPHAPEGVKSQVLGKATLAKTDDMGRWFDFELQRSKPYTDFVLKMDDMGILGASTQTFPLGKTVGEDGGIDEWLEGEVTLTLTPADPKTIQQVEEIAKSFNLPVPTLIKAEEAPEAAPATTPASTPAPAADKAEEEDDIGKILNGADDPAKTEEPAADAKSAAPASPEQFEALMAELREQKAQLATFKAWIWGGVDLHGSPSEGESLFDVLRAMQQLLESQGDTAKSLKKGLVSMAEFLAKKHTEALADMVKKSKDEDEADEIVESVNSRKNFPRLKSNIPEHAPGG